MIDAQTQKPVTARDRVSDVLRRDESLIEVFVRAAPHFAKLRNRAMRSVMARLITVEEAARTANVPVESLVRDLNATLGLATEPVPDVDTARERREERATLSVPTSARVVELDVRDDLRSGREPFSRIMRTVSELGDDEVLRLRAIFEPVPLYTVLAKRGFVYMSEAHAPDDWCVWFWRPKHENPQGNATDSVVTSGREEQVGASDEPAPASDATSIWLDVRGLNPPEPMMRTLAAVETLPAGHTLVQVNSRVPQLLFPILAERGYLCEVDESEVDRVIVRIWRNP